MDKLVQWKKKYMMQLTVEETNFLEKIRENSLVDVKTQIALQRFSICFTDKNKRTALHWAAYYGHKEILEAILAEFLDCSSFNYKLKLFEEPWTSSGWLNFQDNDGNTALHLAVHKFHYDCVLALTANRTTSKQTEMKNNKGDTPVHIAAIIPLEFPQNLLANNRIWEYFQRNLLIKNILNEQSLTPNSLREQQGNVRKQILNTAEAGKYIFQKVFLPTDRARAVIKKLIWFGGIFFALYNLINTAMNGHVVSAKTDFKPDTMTSNSNSISPNFALTVLSILSIYLFQPIFDNINFETQRTMENTRLSSI